MKHLNILILIIFLCSCQKQQVIKNLPVAVTNNAVALVANGKDIELYTFNGLLKGKTWKDITSRGYQWKNNNWQLLSKPINSLPVLASTAVSIKDKIYVIGGYTVNEKGEEKSVPYIFEFDTNIQSWKTKTTMPIPVDDTVALTYADRYIYFISGWHDVDNVSDVQVYDIRDDRWFPATDYPAPAVFGQAGGIVNNTMLICDGVKVVPNEKSRDFVASAVCMKGVIDPGNLNKIEWSKIPHHSDNTYYRMAAIGDIENNRIVFAGGSDNPYNYNGIGYDEVPSQASSLVFTYNLATNQWQKHEGIIDKNMDHRALLSDGEWFYIVGGMKANQEVSNQVLRFRLNE